MVKEKLLVASGMIVLFTTACGSLPTANFTETASATTFFELSVTDTVGSDTATSLIDTPSATLTESSLLISAVLREIVGEHRVAEGETLSCIGRAYGVLPKAIADANGLEVTAELNAGQVLQIPSAPWINIPAGETCTPQFSPPFQTASVPNSTALPRTPLSNWTSTSTEGAPTETSSPATLTNPPTESWTPIPEPTTVTPELPTVQVPPDDTPTSVSSAIPDTSVPPTVQVPPDDTPTSAPSAIPDTPIGTPIIVVPIPSLIFVTVVP